MGRKKTARGAPGPAGPPRVLENGNIFGKIGLKVRTMGLFFLYNQGIGSAHDQKEVHGMLTMLVALLFAFGGTGGTLLGVLLFPLLVILECAKRSK